MIPIVIVAHLLPDHDCVSVRRARSPSDTPQLTSFPRSDSGVNSSATTQKGPYATWDTRPKTDKAAHALDCQVSHPVPVRPEN